MIRRSRKDGLQLTAGAFGGDDDSGLGSPTAASRARLEAALPSACAGAGEDAAAATRGLLMTLELLVKLLPPGTTGDATSAGRL